MSDERRDDWHNSVDSRLVNLTSAQKSADVHLDKLQKGQEKHDKILRGDPARNIKGTIEQSNHLENEINKFNRIFDKDYLGHGGLVSFITYLYDQEKHREERAGFKWSFLNSATLAVSSIIVAMITLVGSLILSWDKVEAFWNHHNRVGPLEQKIERAKRPRGGKRIRIRYVPPPVEEPNLEVDGSADEKGDR